MNPTSRFVICATLVVAACEPSAAPTQATAAPNSTVLAVKGGNKCEIVLVYPTKATIQIGSTLALVDTVANKKGVVLTGDPVSWASQNSAVATVSSNGVVTGISSGNTSIVVTCETGLTASSSISVTP